MDIFEISISGKVKAEFRDNKLFFSDKSIVILENNILHICSSSCIINGINIENCDATISLKNNVITINGKKPIDDLNNTSEKEGVLSFSLNKHEVNIKKISLYNQSSLIFNSNKVLENIEETHLAGHSYLEFSSLTLNKLQIDCKDEANLSISNIEVEDLNINCSGQSYITGENISYRFFANKNQIQ